MIDGAATVTNRDAAQLSVLGYVSNFDRTMSKWENFSLGFTYLSPVVGVYTIFATAFIAGGSPMTARPSLGQLKASVSYTCETGNRRHWR